jgi:hypothetical protein
MESGDAEAITHNNEHSITQSHVSFFFPFKSARKSGVSRQNTWQSRSSVRSNNFEEIYR